MIPQKLRIIGKDISVNVCEELEDRLGECRIEESIIAIKSGQSLFLEADTLVHECLHMLDERFQLNLTERQIYCTTVGLLTILKDNPSLLQYLNKAITD